jgi:hypothetical protein
MSFNGAPVMAASVVAVDVGKNMAALSVTSPDRQRLFGPTDFAMTAPALAAVLQRVCAVLPVGPVKVGWKQLGIITGRCWDLGSGRWLGRFWSLIRLGSVSSDGCRAGAESRPMPSIWRRSPSWC